MVGAVIAGASIGISTGVATGAGAGVVGIGAVGALSSASIKEA